MGADAPGGKKRRDRIPTEAIGAYMEGDDRRRLLIIEALKRNANPKVLVQLLAHAAGVARYDIPNHPEIPDENAIKYRMAVVTGNSLPRYRAYLESLGTGALTEDEQQALVAEARAFMFKTVPNDFWRTDHDVKRIAAELIAAGATPLLLYKALSLHLSEVSDDAFSEGAVFGWLRRTQKSAGEGSDALRAVLHGDDIYTDDEAASAHSEAARLIRLVEARRNEHRGWKQNNEARAIAAAILEQYPTGAGRVINHMLHDRYDVGEQDFESSIQQDIALYGLAEYIQRLRDGIYESEDARAALLERAHDAAQNYIDTIEAHKDVNYAIAARTRVAEVPPTISAVDKERAVIDRLMRRKEARHGGPAVPARNPTGKGRKQADE